MDNTDWKAIVHSVLKANGMMRVSMENQAGVIKKIVLDQVANTTYEMPLKLHEFDENDLEEGVMQKYAIDPEGVEFVE